MEPRHHPRSQKKKSNKQLKKVGEYDLLVEVMVVERVVETWRRPLVDKSSMRR